MDKQLLCVLALMMCMNLTSGQERHKIMKEAKNVLGGELKTCCMDPMTGFYRDGKCNTGADDRGVHVVCAVVTEDFLGYSRSCGNDLITPNPMFGFPGLKPGDKWCLCAARWKEAYEAGVAPPVVLASTHEKALQIVSLDVLEAHAWNSAEAEQDNSQ